MTRKFLAVAIGIASILPAGTAIGQAGWIPGAEIVGQSAQVQTNGVLNTVHFDPAGSARIVTPSGNVVRGAWSATNGQLCLGTGAAQECWPYTSPFQVGQPVTLTSSCHAVSTWTALSTNPQPVRQGAGERG